MFFRDGKSPAWQPTHSGISGLKRKAISMAPRASSSSTKKTLYHSELRGIGWITAVIKSDVMASKHRGRAPYVEMEIDGVQRYYDCENERCAQQLTGFKNQTIVIRAIGSAEDADIEFEDPEAGQPAPPPPARQAAPPPQRQAPPARAAAPPARQQSRAPATAAPPAQRPPERPPATNAPSPAPAKPTQRTPEQELWEVRKMLGQQANLHLLVLDAALSIFTRFEQKHPDRTALLGAELFRNFCTALGMHSDKQFAGAKLPSGLLPGYMPAAGAAPPDPSDNDGGASGYGGVA